MQKYTKLILEELQEKQRDQREYELEGLINTEASRGFTVLQPGCVWQYLEINSKYIADIVDTALKCEKMTLAKMPVRPESDYYISLSDELRQIVEREYSTARSRTIDRFQVRDNDQSRQMIEEFIADKTLKERLSVNRRVETLQEELKLGIAASPNVTTIHIGGDVGSINTGVIYGSVHSKISKLVEGNQSEVIKAFSQLLDAINNSTADPSVKQDRMQNIEFLVEQYQLPAEQRKTSLVSAVITSLSIAADIATVWTPVAPLILKAFGLVVG